MKKIFLDEHKRLKALKKRLEEARYGEKLRKKYAKILNDHFKSNGYGHQLFKIVNASTSSTSKGENKDGKPE